MSTPYHTGRMKIGTHPAPVQRCNPDVSHDMYQLQRVLLPEPKRLRGGYTAPLAYTALWCIFVAAMCTYGWSS